MGNCNLCCFEMETQRKFPSAFSLQTPVWPFTYRAEAPIRLHCEVWCLLKIEVGTENQIFLIKTSLEHKEHLVDLHNLKNQLKRVQFGIPYTVDKTTGEWVNFLGSGFHAAFYGERGK